MSSFGKRAVMIISDLDHLEVITEETILEGGITVGLTLFNNTTLSPTRLLIENISGLPYSYIGQNVNISGNQSSSTMSNFSIGNPAFVHASASSSMSA